MKLRHEKTLITGKPGAGKTTLIQKIVRRMRSVNMAGFYTAEIRLKGSRLGFELQALNGERRTLAHVEIEGQHRVGRYGVNKDGFEEFLGTLDLLNPSVELIVIDEIGKMELFSNRFRNIVCGALNADKQVLATIPLKGNDFIREIRQRVDTHLFEVTRGNRDLLLEEIVEEL
jgi:nucleoside-triphosphatase